MADTSPRMYIILNRGLGMSTGKAAAQAAHAAVEAYRLSDANLLHDWYLGDHYTKIVLSAPSTPQLLVMERYIQDRGFKTALIVDEGRTEVAKFSPTAVGVELVDALHPHVKATFEAFDLYRDDPDPASQSARISLRRFLRRTP